MPNVRVLMDKTNTIMRKTAYSRDNPNISRETLNTIVSSRFAYACKVSKFRRLVRDGPLRRQLLPDKFLKVSRLIKRCTAAKD